MNRKELYQKTVDLLLDAYNSNNLLHGDCRKCAVGNICGDNIWQHDFCTISNRKQQPRRGLRREEDLRPILQKMYLRTGYTKEELAKIEFVFENSVYETGRDDNAFDKKAIFSYGHYSSMEQECNYYYWPNINLKKGQLIGLCAVLDVLKEIHEAPIEESKKNKNRLEGIAKDKFSVAI